MTALRLSPLRSIRRFCVYCMGGQAQHIAGCTAPTCPLYPYRSGRTGRTKDIPQASRDAAAARLKAWRATNKEAR